MPSIKVPVTSGFAPDNDWQADRRAEVAGMVSAVFQFMMDHGTPEDEAFDDMAPALTLFLTAWHNVAFAFGGNEIPDELAAKGAPDVTIPAWKVWLVRRLFRVAPGWQ